MGASVTPGKKFGSCVPLFSRQMGRYRSLQGRCAWARATLPFSLVFFPVHCTVRFAVAVC